MTIRVANSQLTNTIYAGTVKGNLWGKNKTDVTMDCLVAVAEHATKFGEPVVISKESGEPEYTIIVTKHEQDNGQ